ASISWRRLPGWRVARPLGLFEYGIATLADQRSENRVAARVAGSDAEFSRPCARCRPVPATGGCQRLRRLRPADCQQTERAVRYGFCSAGLPVPDGQTTFDP